MSDNTSMNIFGPSSRNQLSGADHRLQEVAYKVLVIKDHSVIKGHRGQVEQDAAFVAGASKLKWPDGKHNGIPSLAIDVQTYPRPDDEQALREDQLYLLGMYVGIGSEMGITLRSGADWDKDGEVSDNGFDDFFHIELVEDSV